jgi:hypothetical protein
VLKPTSLSPFFSLAAFVSPGSTGTCLSDVVQLLSQHAVKVTSYAK